ncbi:MAG: hypothetical protein ACLPX8_08795 [Bryobacteraceae bacterium]|jgi:hypothetical protein
MDQKSTLDEGFDVGTWVGRRQAFALVAGRCSAAEAEILLEIREKKLFRTMEPTWEDFCVKRLGITRGYVDRVIRQFRALGPNLSKLSCFTPIRPAEYRLIAEAITEDGLCYGGEVIALEPENAPKLAEAVEALRRDSTPEAGPSDLAEESLARAEKAMKAAVTELQRLQTMTLDDARRLRLLIAVASCRDQLDLIHLSARM